MLPLGTNKVPARIKQGGGLNTCHLWFTGNAGDTGTTLREKQSDQPRMWGKGEMAGLFEKVNVINKQQQQWKGRGLFFLQKDWAKNQMQWENSDWTQKTSTWHLGKTGVGGGDRMTAENQSWLFACGHCGHGPWHLLWDRRAGYRPTCCRHASSLEVVQGECTCIRMGHPRSIHKIRVKILAF